MSLHDVSRSANLNRNKYTPVDEDTSSPGVLQMEESESDSNRSPFHSDQEHKGSCESLSEGNYADEEDSQHMQDETINRRSFNPVSEDKGDYQKVPDSAPLPTKKEHLIESEESVDKQHLAKSSVQERDLESESQPPAKKFVGNLDVTELSDISEDENNFSNLSEEEKEKQYEPEENVKQSFKTTSLESSKSMGLANVSDELNLVGANFTSNETVPNKSNEKGIGLISDKDKKPTSKADNSKMGEKVGFEEEISNNDKSTEKVDAQPDNDSNAVYCNGFDSKEGQKDEENNLKETEETNASIIQTEQTPMLLTNILRFDFIGENGNESGSSKASDTDCQKNIGKYDKQNESNVGAKPADYTKEDDCNDGTTENINSVKNDALEGKSKADIVDSSGNNNPSNCSTDSLPEFSGGIKFSSSSLYLHKCTVQIDPLPSNLIPKKDSFVVLPRSELLKRIKPRKPAPKMIPVKKRRFKVREIKSDDVPKPARIRRPKRRLSKRPESVPMAPKRKRPRPRDRSGVKPSKRRLEDETKDLSKLKNQVEETKTSSRLREKNSKKDKVMETKNVKELSRKIKPKLEPKRIKDKGKKVSPKNKSNVKMQPRKQNSKAIPSKRVTRSSQRNK